MARLVLPLAAALALSAAGCDRDDAHAGQQGHRQRPGRRHQRARRAGRPRELRDLMAQMGHDSMQAAVLFQHATTEADARIAAVLDAGLTTHEDQVAGVSEGDRRARGLLWASLADSPTCWRYGR